MWFFKKEKEVTMPFLTGIYINILTITQIMIAVHMEEKCEWEISKSPVFSLTAQISRWILILQGRDEVVVKAVIRIRAHPTLSTGTAANRLRLRIVR